MDAVDPPVAVQRDGLAPPGLAKAEAAIVEEAQVVIRPDRRVQRAIAERAGGGRYVACVRA